VAGALQICTDCATIRRLAIDAANAQSPSADPLMRASALLGAQTKIQVPGYRHCTGTSSLTDEKAGAAKLTKISCLGSNRHQTLIFFPLSTFYSQASFAGVLEPC